MTSRPRQRPKLREIRGPPSKQGHAETEEVRPGAPLCGVAMTMLTMPVILQKCIGAPQRCYGYLCKSFSLLLQQAGRDGEQSEVWEAATRLGHFLEAVVPPMLHGSQLGLHDMPQRCEQPLPATDQKQVR